MLRAGESWGQGRAVVCVPVAGRVCLCLDGRLTAWVNCHDASSEVVFLSALVRPREKASIHGSYILSELSVHIKLTLAAWQGCFRMLSHAEERDTCQESGDRELLLGSTTRKARYLNPILWLFTRSLFTHWRHCACALHRFRLTQHGCSCDTHLPASYLFIIVLFFLNLHLAFSRLFFCRFIFKILTHSC